MPDNFTRQTKTDPLGLKGLKVEIEIPGENLDCCQKATIYPVC